MKLFQSRAAHMEGHTICISYGEGYPNNNYPNGGGYCYHDFIEIEFFVSGGGIHHINGIPYRVDRGYFHLLMPGDYHYYDLDESVPFEIYNIKIESAIHGMTAVKLLEEYSRPIAAYLEKEEYQTVLREFEFFYKHWTEQKARGMNTADSLTRNCVERIILLLIRNIQKGNMSVQTSLPREMGIIVDYVNKHFKEQITSNDMAKLTGLTSHYFSSYFKKHSGVAFCDYVNRVRLFHAAELLFTTDLSLKEIANISGFNSQAYFSRLFVKQFLMPPSQYRNSKC